MDQNRLDLESLVVVLTTESNKEKAENLSKIILEKKLAACISLHEVESHYWWKNNLEKASEVQLFIKTTKYNIKEIVSVINEKSSYKTPELIYNYVSSSSLYRDWAEEVTSPDIDPSRESS